MSNKMKIIILTVPYQITDESKNKNHIVKNFAYEDFPNGTGHLEKLDKNKYYVSCLVQFIEGCPFKTTNKAIMIFGHGVITFFKEGSKKIKERYIILLPPPEWVLKLIFRSIKIKRHIEFTNLDKMFSIS